MKQSYLTTEFQKTVRDDFPAQTESLNAAFSSRLAQLHQENAGASSQKQRHLESQILPRITAYETLQQVMSKEDALQTVHSYVERRAWKLKKILLRLMRIPGLYRRVPALFSQGTATTLHTTAYIPNCTGTGPRRLAAVLIAVIFA